MTTILPLLLVSTLYGGGPTTTGAAPSRTVFQEIDARYQRGEIDLGTRHLYRVAAIRRPELLPGDLRALQGRATVRSGTRFLVEGFQHVARTGDFGGAVHDLLQPPADYAYVLESTLWPIRISYQSPEGQPYAQAVLDAADLSYNVQIGDFGFYQPVVEPGYEPYRFYIGETGSGVAGYTAPYDENPATDWADCFTYIFINPGLGMDGVGSTVAHEINHSMQAAMDCYEVTTFWENTATYIEGQTLPDWLGQTYWLIPSFQSRPWRALDYFEQGSGYQYGGVLWLYYLVDALAPDDGPVFVREIWEASMQSGWYANEPDYYDATEEVLASRGIASASMEELYTDFAEARYFVSSNDDGQHITGASGFWNAEPALAGHHTAADLPVINGEPLGERRPAPYGTNFIRVELQPGSSRPLEVAFNGQDTTRWAVRAVLVGEGLTTESATLALDESTWDASLVVQPDGHDQLLLVIANLGEEDYDPDDKAWPLGGYVYSIVPVIDAPTVTAIYPAAVTRGNQNLRMRMTGENFVYGPEFEIRFYDPLIEVVSIDSLTDTEVMFSITIPASASLGVKDVTVVNAGGEHDTGTGLLTIVDEWDTTDPGPRPKGCSAGGAGGASTGGTGGGLLLLLSLLVGRLRRRR
ncbi:MAG: DUF6055 domain-containing protein [bacterium]